MSDNRRPVKVLGDRDRDRVDFTPVDTTIAELASAPFHKHRPNDRRIEPEELQVYRIKARLLRVKLEMDSDLHLRLADVDDPQQRIIAEIPAPECSVGTGHEEEYRAARAALNLIPVGSVVEVVGVAFFDFKHAAKGAARNAIELHPVLAIRSAQSPLAPAMATGPATQEPTLESRTVEPAEGDQ